VPVTFPHYPSITENLKGGVGEEDELKGINQMGWNNNIQESYHGTKKKNKDSANKDLQSRTFSQNKKKEKKGEYHRLAKK